MLFKRNKYLNQIKEQLWDYNKILFLIWPRQIWKTTLLKSLIKFNYIDSTNTFRIDWDKLNIEIQSYNEFISFLKLKTDLKKIKFLIIDEVHFIKNIWMLLKNLVDDIRKWIYNFKIICSWSWSLNVFKGITDSLIGRKQTIYIYWFDFYEFLEIKWININNIQIQNLTENLLLQIKNLFFEYLKFWWYPAVVLANTEKEKKQIFEEIIEDYFYKDIKNFLSKTEFLNFKQALKLFAEKCWTIFSVSKFIQELWINKYLFEKLKFILENTFVIKFVPPFVWWKDKLEIKKSNKIYFYDNWIFRYFLWLEERIWNFKWKSVENYIFSQITANKFNFQDIYFRQRKNETEIDFILYDNFDKKIDLIEVKSWKKDNIPKAINSFLNKYTKFVNNIIITHEWIYKQRKINDKIVFFVPYETIWNFIKNITD